MPDAGGYWFPQPLNVPTVWHYTSATGLIGMLSDRVIWATECTALNDVSEIIEGFRHIRGWLERHSSAAADFLHQLAADDTLEWAQRVFVVCASVNDDDAGQWRLYGGPRAGYAAEIDARVPLQVVSRAAEDIDQEGDALSVWFRKFGQMATTTAWHRVAYSDPERDALLADLLAWAEARFDEFERTRQRPAVDEDDVDFLGQQLRDDFQTALGTAAALIKSPGFSGEQEARVIVDAGLVGDHVEFRASESGVVRYVRLTGGTSSGRVVPEEPKSYTLPVKSITVRKTPYFESEKRTLTSLVARGGLVPAEVPIGQSLVELRW